MAKVAKLGEAGRGSCVELKLVLMATSTASLRTGNANAPSAWRSRHLEVAVAYHVIRQLIEMILKVSGTSNKIGEG